MSIETSYNKWAEQYDSNKNRTRDLDKKATKETLNNYSFETVIELGCGTGKNTSFLLSKAKEIIALDFSAKMLKIASTKINDPRVKFQKTDLAGDWGIVDSYADLITCSLVLEHIKDLNVVFSQAQKKLKTGALFFISELHPIKQYIGSKARFEDTNGTHLLETFTHHISEFLFSANLNGFELLELKEWFDEDNIIEIPRLIGLVFKKSDR